MDRGLSYGKAYDELPIRSKHTSFLVNCLSFDKMSISCSQTQNDVARQLENLNLYYANSDIGKMDHFKALIEKYTPYAQQKSL